MSEPAADGQVTETPATEIPAVEPAAEPVVEPEGGAIGTPEPEADTGGAIGKPEEVIPEVVIPEEYAELELAEGLEVSAEEYSQIKAFAKESGFTQEKFEALVNMKLQAEQNITQKHINDFAETRKGWLEEMKKDQNYGGINYEANLKRAGSVLAKFDSSGEFGKMLYETGYGDSPYIFGFLNRVADIISNDTLVKDKAVVETEKLPIEERMWPNMAK